MKAFFLQNPSSMRFAFLIFCCFSCASFSYSQISPQAENIFIITTDGFRWQEVFTGADQRLLSDSKYVEDTSLARQLYWDNDVYKRRQKLMPFIWNVVAEQGQLYGNRLLGNKSNAANLYKISYPGYNEILSGGTDPRIMLNLPRINKNMTILEWLNKEADYHGKVVAFSSWYIFPYILNKERSGILINSGYQKMDTVFADTAFGLINKVQENVPEKLPTRYDWLTFLNASEYIKQYHPKIVFISLGETDEFAHQGHYDQYLQHANAVDKMISDLWYYVQTNSFYKNKTAFIITTDHGRGKTEDNWTNHSLLTDGSAQTWLAMIGPGIEPLGEMKNEGQVYQKQIAPTVAMLLGRTFNPNTKIGTPINLPERDFLKNSNSLSQAVGK
jgi:hypothetical protein